MTFCIFWHQKHVSIPSGRYIWPCEATKFSKRVLRQIQSERFLHFPTYNCCNSVAIGATTIFVVPNSRKLRHESFLLDRFWISVLGGVKSQLKLAQVAPNLIHPYQYVHPESKQKVWVNFFDSASSILPKKHGIFQYQQHACILLRSHIQTCQPRNISK